MRRARDRRWRTGRPPCHPEAGGAPEGRSAPKDPQPEAGAGWLTIGGSFGALRPLRRLRQPQDHWGVFGSDPPPPAEAGGYGSHAGYAGKRIYQRASPREHRILEALAGMVP
jgi:hypothetical protein